MTRSLFPFLATGWAVLWAVLSLTTGASDLYHTNGSGIIFMVIASGWMFGWLRSDAPTLISMKHAGHWMLSAIGLVPVLVFATVSIFDHRYVPAGMPVHHHVAAELARVIFFCAPWLLLVFGAKALREEFAPPPIAGREPIAAPENARSRPTGTLLVPIGDVLRPLDGRKILWLEAEGNYVRVYTADRDYLVRGSLRDLTAKLGENRFARIHKSRAVNVAEIAGIRPLAKGDAEIHLRNGLKLRLSRRFRPELPSFLTP